METSESVELFDWIADDRLEEFVVKLNALPSGSEFKRRVEEEITATIRAEGRTYEEIVDDHGDLVGYVDEEGSRLPWWLQDFEWTIASDPLDLLTIDENTLDEFEQYPLDSTQIDDIALVGSQSLVNGLDAFLSLEEQLSTALDLEVSELIPTANSDPTEFDLPEKLFVVPEAGRISTSEAFENWFERTLNLCPPAAPELTALLRVNANIEHRHAAEVLASDQLQRLAELSVFQSSDGDARAHNDAYLDSLVTLLQIKPPFDLDLDISNDKESLTDLQYAYYRAWASDTPRLSNEQRWLRAAQNTESISEGYSYRFAEYAFRMPLRLDNMTVVFEDQARHGDYQVREQIVSVLEEYGHPANDD